jgi:hypothetical protein
LPPLPHPWRQPLRALYFEASTSSEAFPSQDVMVPNRISRVLTLASSKLIFFFFFFAIIFTPSRSAEIRRRVVI